MCRSNLEVAAVLGPADESGSSQYDFVDLTGIGILVAEDVDLEDSLLLKNSWDTLAVVEAVEETHEIVLNSGGGTFSKAISNLKKK